MPKKNTKRAAEDIVRVMRIVEYVGPRSWVEKTLAKSIQGVMRPAEGRKVCAVTVGDYPEILVKAGEFVRDQGSIDFYVVDNPPKPHAADAPFVVEVPRLPTL